MNELIGQGLVLSITGITLTFASLGLLVLLMILLQRFFSPQPPAVEEPVSPAEASPSPVPDSPSEEVVAAIVAALAHLSAEDEAKGKLGALLQSGRGRYWNRGQMQQRR